MNSTEIVIRFPPVPAARPKVTKKGIAYYPKAYNEYKKKLEEFFHSDSALPFPCDSTDPITLTAEFVMPRYKTSTHPFSRCDLDNLWKLPIDVMTKAQKYWTDDHQIVHTLITKRFANEGEEPHTKLTIGLFKDAKPGSLDSPWVCPIGYKGCERDCGSYVCGN